MIRLGHMTDNEKALEILILRGQLDILERKQEWRIKPNRAEKLFLAVLTARLKKATNRPASQLRDVIRICQPETVLRWHRELVRRKWMFQRIAIGGSPAHQPGAGSPDRSPGRGEYLLGLRKNRRGATQARICSLRQHRSQRP